jgi:gliding motility-associated-like protein
MDVNIFSGSNLDETTWNITNSLGVIIASGGPYASGSNQTITVNAPSNPPFTFNLETQGTSNSNVAGYNVMCSGTSISGGLAILTGGQTIAIPISGCPGSIPTTLSWSPGATLSSTTIANPVASPSTTTTYTLTASANGCTSNDDVVVTVVPGPTVTVNNATICSGQTAALTATPSAAGGTYLWSPGGATTQTINVSPTTTTTYTVTYSNGSCASTPASGVVTVSASPTLSVNSSTICPGGSATLTATASPSGGTYLWSPGGATTQTLTVSPTNTTIYSVDYGLNGCSSSSANGTVTVSNVVDWANIQSPGTATICQGQTLTIYGQVFEAGVTPPAGQGAGITVQFAYNTSNTNPSTWPSASWSTATYNPLSLINPNNDEYSGVIPALSPGTYYYSFSYTMNGCTSYGGFSAAGGGFWDGTTNVNGTLIVNPNVTPTFNPITAICAGGALNALPTSSTNLITGTWSPALSNQTTTTYTFTPAVGVCATTATLTVTVNPLPIAAITAPTTTILTCATPSITLTATGGGTYSWSNGTAVVGSSSTLNVTSPGTYTVTVTSASGCVATASQIITQNISLPVVAITPPSTSILTCTTTSINLTATGGGTYSWSNGTAVVGTTATISVNTPATYTCTITGSNGCTASISQVITQNISVPNAAITAPSTTILTCTTPSIDLQATGGVSYAWSNGTSSLGTNSLISASTPGTYTATVTGANGCIGTASQVITQNITLPNAAITTPATSILTCSTPTINLTGTGGGTYSWFDGSSVVGTTATVTISAANTYTLTVTGANGCDATTTITITDNFLAPTPSINASNTILTCSTTSITLVASGGGTYAWTGGSTSASLVVTTSGTYTVTVTSPNGCTATSSQVITQNITAPTTSISSSNNAELTCAVTSVTLTATGGGTYLWGTGATTASISVTTPGTYPVTVTSSNGCTATASQVVTQNITAPTAAITPPSTTVLTCATTSISLVATGGTSYAWSNGTTNVGNSATLSVTLPGTYTVSVTGANGCSATAAITITQNSTPPPANINPPTSTELNCTTTSITLTATGGVGYSWSNGTAVLGTNAALTVTTPGTYTVTVTAAIGCTATATQIITQNTAPPIVVITPPTSTILTCTTTSIQLTATGGGTYSWSNGTTVIGTTASVSVTSAGTYTVTVTGANGCTATGTQVITQNVSLPLAAITAPSTNVLTCTVTSINLTATGGTSYSWSNGTAIVGTTATISVNTPGTYTVTVTGSNGCTATAVQNITQNISAPNVTIAPPSTTILTCTATNINLIASGGSYSWSNGTTVVGTSSILAVSAPGTYTVTVTGGNGCTGTASQTITQNVTAPVAAINSLTTTILTCTTPTITMTATGGGTYSWSNGTAIVGTNASLNVTTPGTYTVTVTAANGCTATASQVITQNNTAPLLTITPPSSSVLTCTTTSISLTANGVGTISWTNPTKINPTMSVTTPGVYTVTLTAANGCTASVSQTITQNISAPVAAITAPSTTVITCTTTSITLTATGGGTYSWSNGTAVVGTSAALVVTTPGTYTVTVTGTNGCTATAASTITQNTTAPTAGINTPSTSILTCTTPSISLTATGGGSYSWSNGTTNVGNSATLSVTNPGFYTVVVTAPNGCSSLTNFVITQDIVAPIASITNNTNTTVLDCNTTQISLTGLGGTSASWSNGTSVVSSVTSLNVTTAGTYTYTGTNANGCFDTESITITFTPNTNPSFTQIAAICTNGTFTLPTTSTNNVAGTWSPAPNYTATTTYTFQPNTGLCANTASMTITVHPYPVVTTQNDTICVGQSATITSNVNLAGGTYSWTPTSPATASISVSPIATTNYQVIYSLNGCADTSTTEIYVKPVSTPITTNQTICNGQTAELIATAPLAGGTFVWSTTQINDTIQVSPVSTTTYSVVYNLNGCVSPIVNSLVTVNPVPTLGVNNSTICAGDNATITAIPNLLGGTFYWGTPAVAGGASQTISPLNDTTISVYYTLNGCTSPVATSSITVNPLPIATFSAAVTQGCAPLSINLIADDASNTTYTWSTSNALTGTGSQTNLNFQMNGGFDVSLTTTLNGCTVTETLSNYIQVDNYPIAAFEPSSTMFTEPNQTLNFMNNSLGASTYAWNFGDGGTSTEEGPNHTFIGNELGFTIVLTAISNLGCVDTTQYFIGYDPGLVYYIPNSFTPDGDMNNQVFNPVFTSGIDIYHYTMYIFNRWGEIIFESNDPSIGWDGSYGVEGKDAEVGVYTYQIFIKIPTFDERKMIVGHVNLIR